MAKNNNIIDWSRRAKAGLWLQCSDLLAAAQPAALVMVSRVGQQQQRPADVLDFSLSRLVADDHHHYHHTTELALVGTRSATPTFALPAPFRSRVLELHRDECRCQSNSFSRRLEFSTKFSLLTSSSHLAGKRLTS
jgi:hypothetical protein